MKATITFNSIVFGEIVNNNAAIHNNLLDPEEVEFIFEKSLNYTLNQNLVGNGGMELLLEISPIPMASVSCLISCHNHTQTEYYNLDNGFMVQVDKLKIKGIQILTEQYNLRIKIKF